MLKVDTVQPKFLVVNYHLKKDQSYEMDREVLQRI